MSDLKADYQVRRLSVEDAPRCLEISQAVGWSHDLGVWKQMIALGGEGSLAVSVDDTIAATNIATMYGAALAWLGLVITHPDYQRRGYGKQLMQAVMALLREHSVSRVMLDATEAGRPLYESYGFRPLYRIEIWAREAGESPASASASVRCMVPDDLREVAALDAELFGLPRAQVLEVRSRNAWVTVESGKITGYLLSRVSESGAALGPWHHRSPAGAEALLNTALSALGDRPVRAHIPELNTQAKAIAARCGLTYRRYCTRMLYGEQPLGHMADQYAIASFATG